MEKGGKRKREQHDDGKMFSSASVSSVWPTKIPTEISSVL
jgi:hypothetical protein